MKNEKFKRYRTSSFRHSASKRLLSAFSILHFFITHFCAASEPKTSICLAGGLPTDGNADLRISTFAACGFELKTVNVSARKLNHGSPTNCCRSRKCLRTVHPQFGFAIRLNYQTLAFCRFAAQDIWRLRTFGVLADSTLGVLGLTKVRLAQIGKLFPDNSLGRRLFGQNLAICG